MCMGWQGKEGEELQTYVSKVFDVYGLAGQKEPITWPRDSCLRTSSREQ